MNSAVAEKTYPIQTLVDIANQQPAKSISHTRKLLSVGLITKTYEKVGNGPGRSIRSFKITDDGRRYLRISGVKLSQDAQTSPVKVRRTKSVVPEHDRVESLTGDNLRNTVKSLMMELIAEDRAAKMPLPPRRKRGRPTKEEIARRNIRAESLTSSEV